MLQTTLVDGLVATPIVSVIVLNYNGAAWIERCLASLRSQTLRARMEVLVADNASADGSDHQAARLIEGWPEARLIQNGSNLGFAEGNNRPAAVARGYYLFFLNNDAWLEPDCLERLIAEVQNAGAAAATPAVLNYGDDSFQSLGAAGFDVFGLTSTRLAHAETREVLMPEGCSYLVERELFLALGGFDREFFMFAEEYDLSWRLWVAGRRSLAAPAARVHHRGAAEANPAGGERVVEMRTSDTKRFYANRNHLLVALKNTQWLWLLWLPLQLLLIGAEGLAGWVLLRRWSFLSRSFLNPVAECWRLRRHIAAERRRLKPLRQRSDVWMLRFLRMRLNRWDEFQRVRRYGLPKVTAK